MKSIKLTLIIYIGMIIMVCSTILLYRTYTSVTFNIENLTKQQLSLALNFDLAIREYVGETVRPIMYNMVNEGRFIPETMSTSFVARSIFEKVQKNFPDYIIKFASDNPRNPLNQASPEELDMIRYFNENPDNTIWTGEITIAERTYLATFSAMRMEKACLRCHGDPADAPNELIKRYGSNASFYRPLGEVVGLDTIAIHSDNVKDLLFKEKFKNLGFLGMIIIILCATLVFVFKFIITDRLDRITDHFSKAEEQSEKLKIAEVEIDGTDEIAFLAKSFNKLSKKLNDKYIELTMEIEKRKEVQEALHQSEEKYRHLSEGSFEAIVWHDKGKIIDANKQYYELFGYKPEELAGKDAILLTATSDSIKFMRQLISLDHPGPYKAEGVKKDGSVFPMEIRAKMMEYNGKMARMAAIRDLTKHERAKKALQDSEERFRMIFKNSSDGIIVADPETMKFLYVNPAICKMLGYTEEELTQLGVTDIHSKESLEYVVSEFEALKREEKHLAMNIPFLKKNKTIMYMDLNSSIVRMGEKIRIMGVFRDVTERKQAEEMIMSSLKEKELLLSEIHHRVKNNFEIISSLLDMSSMATDNHEIKNLLLGSRTRIHSMASIHSQLYQSESFDQIDMEKHIKELADNLQSLYKSEKKISIEIESAEFYLSINQAIPCALVLNELITNSIKHAFIDKEQGNIQVSFHASDDNTLLIRVKDDGVGIPETIKVKSDRGLGLELAKHLIVGQLQGEIRFYNKNGTEICIEFKRL